MTLEQRSEALQPAGLLTRGKDQARFPNTKVSRRCRRDHVGRMRTARVATTAFAERQRRLVDQSSDDVDAGKATVALLKSDTRGHETPADLRIRAAVRTQVSDHRVSTPLLVATNAHVARRRRIGTAARGAN